MLVCVTSLDESDSSNSDTTSTTTPRRARLRIGKLKKEMQLNLRQNGFDEKIPADKLGNNDQRYFKTLEDGCHRDDATTPSIIQDAPSSAVSEQSGVQDIWRVFNEKHTTDSIDRLGKCVKMLRNELVKMRDQDQQLIRQLISAHRTINSIVCNQYMDTWDSASTFTVDTSDTATIDIKDVVNRIPPLRRRRQSAPDYEEDQDDEPEVYDPLSMSSPMFLSSCYDWKTHHVTLL
ncbi:uncharacterized protein [Antedon mediterranea]|uniref:uncharacterized protein n=1 Tax=Antedon mediterranea TaxID=105859 RepID=UPI003AF59E78